MAKRTTAFGPTQKQIADALGIAQTTVALALNPKYQGRYSPETVLRIQEKAEELGYRPSRFAQIMRSSRSHTVGIIVSSGIYESSRSKLIELVLAFEERGYTVIVADIDWFRGNLEKALAYMLDHSIEGIVFLNISTEINGDNQAFKAFSTRKIPGVETNCNAHFGFTRVEEDIEKAYFDLTMHHLACGAQNPVLLLNQRHSQTAFHTGIGHTVKRRIMGFAKAIHASGGNLEIHFAGPPLDDWLKEVGPPMKPNGKVKARIVAPFIKAEWNNAFDVGRGVAAQLLGCSHPPDSFLCGNDDLAIGAMKACEQAGVAVPGTVLISGYDSTAVSAYAGVPLTTVSAQNRELAKVSASLLIQQIEAGTIAQPAPPQRIPGEIIFRESSERKKPKTRKRSGRTRATHQTPVDQH